MKAISIQQPYAHLIMLPDDDARAKRIENRTWHCGYVGPLLIHAGKGRKFLTLSRDKQRDECYDLPLSEMAFGAIVGICQMRGCVKIHFEANRIVTEDWARRRWPWIDQHEHAEGPFGFVLAECRRFETPIPYKGCLGIFDVPQEIVAVALQEGKTSG